MNHSPIQFNQTEERIVALAANSDVTRRRIWLSVLFPLTLIAVTLAVFGRDAQPRFLLWLYVAYVGINMFEKIGYGLAVLSYKSAIRKLISRIDELEGRPATGAPSDTAIGS